MGAMRTTYSVLCSELASNGFFVAAVEHKDGSASGKTYLSYRAKKNMKNCNFVSIVGAGAARRRFVYNDATRRYCVAYMGTRPARLGAARAGAEIFSYNYRHYSLPLVVGTSFSICSFAVKGQTLITVSRNSTSA